MARLQRILIKAALIALGLTELVHAQQTEVPVFVTNGPQFCPPLNSFLSPTLLDVFYFPGITFQ